MVTNKARLPLLMVLCLLGGLHLPGCQIVKIRDDPGWRRSAASLKWIGGALLAYHDAYKRFPPAVVTDKAGRPLYSWRVVLLPFLEERTLYDQFKLDEPWDSPHNKKLLAATPRCYLPALGGDDAPGLTRYQVLVGPGTAFERPRLMLRHFTDGPAETILAVEARNAVPWSQPADVAYDPNGPLPALGGLFRKDGAEGFNAVFADGTVRFLRGDTAEKTLRGLITRNGGEKVDLPGLE